MGEISIVSILSDVSRCEVHDVVAYSEVYGVTLRQDETMEKEGGGEKDKENVAKSPLAEDKWSDKLCQEFIRGTLCLARTTRLCLRRILCSVGCGHQNICTILYM